MPGFGRASPSMSLSTPAMIFSSVRLARAVEAEHADLGAGEERQRDVLEDLALRRHDLADAVHGVDVLGHGASRKRSSEKGRARAEHAGRSPIVAAAAGLGLRPGIRPSRVPRGDARGPRDAGSAASRGSRRSLTSASCARAAGHPLGIGGVTELRVALAAHAASRPARSGTSTPRSPRRSGAPQICSPEMVPEALRMIRVEPHRLPDPLDAFLRPAEPVSISPCWTTISRCWVEAERPFLVVAALSWSSRSGCSAARIRCTSGSLSSSASAVLSSVVDLLQGGVPVLAPAVDPALAEHAGLPGVRVGVLRVELDRAVEELLRLGVGLARRTVVEHLAGQHVLVRRHVLGRLALARRGWPPRPARAASRRWPTSPRPGSRRCPRAHGHSARPRCACRFRVDELDGDAHAVSGFSTLPSTRYWTSS